MSEQDFVFPVSFAQQRLWLIDQLLPGQFAYNMHVTMPLGAVLDPSLFQKSLDEIVRRHETLRTTFDVQDNQPVQIVHPAVALSVPIIPVRGATIAEQEAEALRLATDEARHPFDLKTGPLLRAKLLRFTTGDYILLLTMHHIISDGWSLGVFFNELKQIYGAFANGGSAASLPELPIQYADFAVWQRDWLQGPVLAEQLEYWKQKLENLPALNLPTDRRRPPVASFRGAAHTFQLSAELTNELKSLSRREGVTLFMVLVGAFKVLLARYSGQHDIVIGAPIANRNRAELETLIGFFVNTLVLRTDLSGEPTFREVLRRVREVTLGAYGHQDLPFEKLVEELRPERNLSRNPLFQVVFQLHNAPTLGLSAATDHSAPPPEAQRGTSNFDLTCDLWETPRGLAGRINYSTDLFDASTIVRLANHYRVLLEAAAANPDQRIHELPLLTEDERRQLLVDWNETHTDYPRDACIHHLFEQWAAQTPKAVAVVFENEHLTYKQLNRRANQIARLLRRRGVRRESLVGLCTERSAEMIAALLGILKAGGAYVALDPAWPAKRLDLVLRDADIKIVLTQRQLTGLFQELEVETICFDELDSSPGPEEDENPAGDATADSLAYVAYTSGSTGTPKGVMVEHRAVVRLVRNTDYAAFNADEVFLQFSPLPFDASTFEIWGSLSNGSKLIVHPPGSASLEELGRTIERNRVTTLWLTAGLFHQMVDRQMERLQGVRQLLAGGEVLSAAHVKKALLAPGQRVIINGYGPTEGTTFTCCYRIADAAQIDETVPIGSPIANTRVFVLDAHGNPVPVGVPGELYIGGDGLARGYLNQADLNAERFVPDHLGAQANQRLYRTGDLVRFRSDGNLEFLGRIDRQIKLRGFRVEPGEVEALLLRREGISNACVVASGDGEHKQLVAYVVSVEATAPTVAELRSFLQEQLPAHMLPAHFVSVREIPLTRNGKIDERRLPPPDRAQAIDGQEFVAPSGAIEESLALIWGEVLNSERMDVHANFFTDLGGHSLLATQVVSRIRETFGIELPLRRFFEVPTIKGLTGAIEEAFIEEIEMMSDEQAEQLLSSPQQAAMAVGMENQQHVD